jgi:hypothetical protein
MNRIPVFILVGPFLAWLIGLAFAYSATYPEPIFEHTRYWPASFIVCYAFSIPPLLVAAWIDRRLSGAWWRFFACGLAGFGIAFVLFYILTHAGGSEEQITRFRQYWFYVGLVWGLPAAVCSLLAGVVQKGARQ